MSPALNRGLAWTLLLALIVALVLTTGLPAWQIYRSDRSSVRDHHEQIERFSMIAAGLASFEQELQQYRDLIARNEGLITQSSPSIAGANLQERLKKLVAQSGGDLNSTRVLSAGELEGFATISVNARMRLSNDSLRQILYDLEAGIPHLLVESIHIAGLGARANDNLDVTMTISGLMNTPN